MSCSQNMAIKGHANVGKKVGEFLQKKKRRKEAVCLEGSSFGCRGFKEQGLAISFGGLQLVLKRKCET